MPYVGPIDYNALVNKPTLGTIAAQDASAVAITGGTLTGATLPSPTMTAAQLATAVGASTLVPFQQYYITDTLAEIIALTSNTYLTLNGGKWETIQTITPAGGEAAFTVTGLNLYSEIMLIVNGILSSGTTTLVCRLSGDGGTTLTPTATFGTFGTTAGSGVLSIQGMRSITNSVSGIITNAGTITADYGGNALTDSNVAVSHINAGVNALKLSDNNSLNFSAGGTIVVRGIKA